MAAHGQRFLEGLRALLPDDWVSRGVREYGRRNLISHKGIITNIKPSHTKMDVENGHNTGGQLELEVTITYDKGTYRVKLNADETHSVMYHRGQQRYVDVLIGDSIKVYSTGQGVPKGIGVRRIQ